MSQLEFTHRRKNLLTGNWVLVSPHRNNRPWQGATEALNEQVLPAHDESCPLCPGNTRANNEINPDYATTFVFTNDFGALTEQPSNANSLNNDDIFKTEVATGVAKVVCFSPDHNKTLPLLTNDELVAVVDTWQENFKALSKKYNCIHIFENKGEMMGCSQPHPHGQIWAHDHWSTEIIDENRQQLEYFQQHGKALLSNYVLRELEHQQRIVCENEHWLVVVPYWAAWPFETLLMTKGDCKTFSDLSAEQKESLACIIKELTTRYDNVFNTSFPYSMGWHNAPKNLDDNSHWRLHAHFYPPLLRSATVKKHMVGYEMLAESQRDLTAETAANILKNASEIHYTQRNLSHD